MPFELTASLRLLSKGKQLKTGVFLNEGHERPVWGVSSDPNEFMKGQRLIPRSPGTLLIDGLVLLALVNLEGDLRDDLGLLGSQANPLNLKALINPKAEAGALEIGLSETFMNSEVLIKIEPAAYLRDQLDQFNELGIPAFASTGSFRASEPTEFVEVWHSRSVDNAARRQARLGTSGNDIQRELDADSVEELAREEFSSYEDLPEEFEG